MKMYLIKLVMKLLPTKVLSQQARKPSGIIGRYLMPQLFVNGNADLNDFVFQCIDLKIDDTICEIGFGPGKLVNKMAGIVSKGSVEGIDFSREMLQEAAAKNRNYIKNGKVRLQHGDCSTLPYPDNHFEKLCTANTIYFWKEPEQHFAEIYRVMKPGGKVVIGFRDKEQMNNLKLSDDVFTTYTRDEVVRFLSNSGFAESHIEEKAGKPFQSYCAVGVKLAKGE